MADLPEQVNGIAMPAGILDFGYNIPDDCIDLLRIGEGSGWGSGQCWTWMSVIGEACLAVSFSRDFSDS